MKDGCIAGRYGRLLFRGGDMAVSPYPHPYKFNRNEVSHLKAFKRSLVLLFVCLLIMSHIAFAAQEEYESSREIVETTEETKSPTEESSNATITIEKSAPAENSLEEPSNETITETEEAPAAEADNVYTARNYVNYYLMPGDSEYLELEASFPYIYSEVNHDNYEQIVFSAIDWPHLSSDAKAKVNAVLAKSVGMSYLELLQKAVTYTLEEESGVVGSACYAVRYGEDMSIIESSGRPDGIAVTSILADAGLSDKITTDCPALMQSSLTTDDSAGFSYGTWGDAYVYRGTATGTLGPVYIGSPFGDVSATYISSTLHVGYFYSSWMDAYYYSYCLSARSVYPQNKWVRSDGEDKWNSLSEGQRRGLAKALMYGEYYRSLNGGDGAYSAVQCVVWSIMHQQMDEYGRGTGSIYDSMHLYDAYYDDCWTTVSKVRDAMWIHGEKPSFTYDSPAAAYAEPIVLTYNAADDTYSSTLTDTSSCAASTWYSGNSYLHDYFTFTAVDDSGNAIDGISFSASGADLTITATKEALAKAEVILVKVLTPTRSGTTYISIYDSIRYLGIGWQPIITNWEDSGSPTYVYMSIKGDEKLPIDPGAPFTLPMTGGTGFTLAAFGMTLFGPPIAASLFYIITYERKIRK